MTHRIIDISSNNAHPINWQQVKASGIDAVFVKATEGTHYINSECTGDIQAAIGAGLLAAAYHFSSHTDAAAEANCFHNAAGKYAKILDSETSTDAAWDLAFLTALAQPAQMEMTYGSQSTLPNNINRGLLWPADYGQAPGRGECWQYTSTGQVPGVNGNVDVSVWTGSEGQWSAFFGIAGPFAGVQNVVGIAATPSGKGYLLVGADGGVFTYGDAQFKGSLGGKTLAAPIVGITVRPDNKGYWLVGADGGVFNFGTAPFYGSMGGIKLVQPVVGIAATPSGNGYWLSARSGLFSFGDASYYGHP